VALESAQPALTLDQKVFTLLEVLFQESGTPVAPSKKKDKEAPWLKVHSLESEDEELQME